MQKRKGFTLVELVIVIAVIAILAGVLIGTFASVIKRANDSAQIQKTKSEEIAQKAEDIINKIENSNWFGWEDFEASIVAKIADVVKGTTTDHLSETQVRAIVEDAVTTIKANIDAKNTGITEDQIKTIVENALGTLRYEGVTEAQVRAIVSAAANGIQGTQLQAAQVRAIVNAANEKNLAAADIIIALNQAGKLALASDVTTAVTNIEAAITSAAANLATKEQVENLKTLIQEATQAVQTADLDDVITAKALNIRIKNAGLTSANTPYEVVSAISATSAELKSTLLLSIEDGQLGFFVVNGNSIVNPCGLTVELGDAKYKYWTFADAVNPNYSTYLTGTTYDTTVIANGVGVDVGTANVTAINYTSNTGHEVVIRTAGGTLTIGSSTAVAEGTITHYGTLDEAIVYTTNNSFHTHGKIASMDLKAGKAVAEDKGYVALVKASAGTLIQEVDSGVFYIPSNAVGSEIDSTVASSIGYISNGETTPSYVVDTTTDEGQKRAQTLASTAYEIGSKFDLIAFRDAVNNGQDFSQIKVVLTNDIDMSGYYWVTPIGTKSDSYIGTFDGQNHKIDNLSNAGHKTTETFTNATSQTQGEIFGLFGYVTGTTIIQNLEVDVNASYTSGKCWAGVVAASAQNKAGEVSNLVLNNIIVRGELSGNDKVAGFVGQAAPYGNTAGSLSITNSKNYANVTASAKRAAGFVGAIGATLATKISDVVFNDCHNYGTISGPSMVGGIVGNVNQSDQDVWDIYKNSVIGTQTWLDVANSSATFTYSECSSTATVSSGRLFNDAIIYGQENVGSVSENYGNRMYAKVHASYFNNINIDGSAVANWNNNDIYRYLSGLAYEEDKTIIAKVAAGDVVRTYVSEYSYGSGSLQGFNAVLNDNYFKNGSTITLEQDLLLTENGESYYSLWAQSGSPTINFNNHDIASSSFELCIRSSSIVLCNLMNGKVKVYTNVAPTINGVKFEAVSSGPVACEYENGILKTNS